MWDPLRLFPRSWFCTVTVTRRAGRDKWGALQPAQIIEVPDCLLAPRATTDPVDHSDLSTGTGVLYHKDFAFQSTDQLSVPAGARMAGKWAVDGIPNEWPFGIEAELVRV